MADIDRAERCKCGADAIRHFAPRFIHLTGTKVTHAEFNPGLGCVVRNAAHKRELMKIKGVEEIGNEPPEKIHKYYDERREEKIEKAYDDATAGWVGDGTS